MSPRATPTRHDDTAIGFLAAAAELIDAALSDATVALPARLRSIHFPAALEWMRVEDVIRLSQAGTRAASKRAFLNRWPSKDEFVRDAVVHCILYHDIPAGGTPDATPESMVATALQQSLSAGIVHTADTILGDLLAHPRSYLLMHLGPMLPRYPEIHAAIAEDAHALQQRWAAGYLQLLQHLGCALRPGWDVSTLSLSLQIMLDGALLRYRIEPDRTAAARWQSASLFANTVTTFIAGALDLTGSGLSAHDWLDEFAATQARAGSLDR